MATPKYDLAPANQPVTGKADIGGGIGGVYLDAVGVLLGLQQTGGRIVVPVGDTRSVKDKVFKIEIPVRVTGGGIALEKARLMERIEKNSLLFPEAEKIIIESIGYDAE